MSDNQKGFGAIEAVIAGLLVLVLVAVGGYTVHKHKSNIPAANCDSITDAQKNITVTCPANNATVGKTFTISGIVHRDDYSVSVIIDGHYEDSDGGEWSYVNAPHPATDFAVSKGGKFSIPINLNGNKVLEDKIPITGGYSTKYIGVAPGKHTFTIKAQGGCTSVCGAISINTGPTITLDVK